MLSRSKDLFCKKTKALKAKGRMKLLLYSEQLGRFNDGVNTGAISNSSSGPRRSCLILISEICQDGLSAPELDLSIRFL